MSQGAAECAQLPGDWVKIKQELRSGSITLALPCKQGAADSKRSEHSAGLVKGILHSLQYIRQMVLRSRMSWKICTEIKRHMSNKLLEYSKFQHFGVHFGALAGFQNGPKGSQRGLRSDPGGHKVT